MVKWETHLNHDQKDHFPLAQFLSLQTIAFPLPLTIRPDFLDPLMQQISPDPLVRCLVVPGLAAENPSEGKGRVVHGLVALAPVPGENDAQGNAAFNRKVSDRVYSLHAGKAHV